MNRSIPAPIKQAVRQRCGFGCVRCGASIYEYEHFDPPFADAKEHSVAGIALLCPSCHALRTKGVLTKEAVAELRRNPATKTNGHSSIDLPEFSGIPKVRLGGGVLIQKTPIPIRIESIPVVGFFPPETGSTVTRINALIVGPGGEDVLRIIDNEWRVSAGVWDFEWIGQRMTVRNATKTALMQLFIAPPHYIGIDRLTIAMEGHEIHITETEAILDGVTVIDCVIDSFYCGIQLGKEPDDGSAKGCGIHIG